MARKKQPYELSLDPGWIIDDNRFVERNKAVAESIRANGSSRPRAEVGAIGYH